MTIRERLLSQTVVYRTMKNLLLRPESELRIVNEMVAATDGARVLDLGCGYGDYARHIAPQCRYLGIDHNPGYIGTARRINAELDVEFVCADVSDQIVADRGPYDVAFLGGVLHHLSDEQVRGLARQVAPLLTDDGRLVALEPVFDPDQRLSARLMIAADRGRHVRDEPGYARLLAPALPNIRTEIHVDLLRLPYTHLAIEARRETSSTVGITA